MSKGLILFAEDKEEFRKIYGDRLRFSGYEVAEATDGEEALAFLKQKSVNLLVTDINMPKMDGFQLIQEVKADEALKNIPILVMSVFDQGEHLKRALDLGANDYLVKGMHTPNAVAEKIDKLLSNEKHV